MRYYGEIKWFGGYNKKKNKSNDFGYIFNLDEKLGLEEIYFHESELLFDIKLAKEGIAVSYGVNENSTAKEIKLLEEEVETSLLERCLNDSSLNIWLSVIKNYSKIVSLEDCITRVECKLSIINNDKLVRLGNYLVKYLPIEFFASSSLIRSRLNVTERLVICLHILHKSGWDNGDILCELINLVDSNNFSEQELIKYIPKKLFLGNKILGQKMSNFNYFKLLLEEVENDKNLALEILKILKEKEFKKIYLNEVPYRLIRDHLWVALPNEIKINYLMNSETDLDEFIQILNLLPESIRYEKTHNLSDELKKNIKLFSYLYPEDKVIIIWDNYFIDIKEMWNKVDYQTKLLLIYRFAKSNLSIDVLNGLREFNPFVRAALKILWAKENNQIKDKVFKESNELIQNYVVDVAWNLDEKLDLYPLLPKCTFNYVKYCEGKPWNNDNVFCPRKKRRCAIEDVTMYKIYPKQNLDWNQWSLLELIDNSNIIPRVANLANPDEYVPKLCGWVNRVIEIRERLKCTECGKTLLSNMKYSKNLAVYNSTVFYCQCGSKSNDSVYISHCWACREIIDSREGNNKIEDYYLCLYCGSGPKKSDHYRQGSKCPKCSSQMNNIDHKVYQCLKCSHKIIVPPDHKLTGNKHVIGQWHRQNG